jgi:hypothetical protein
MAVTRISMENGEIIKRTLQLTYLIGEKVKNP